MCHRYYSGRILDKHPSFGLCLAQAILKHGSDPMFIMASLALILEVLIEIHLLPIQVSHRTKTICVSTSFPSETETMLILNHKLVALPYVTFVIFGIWAAAVSPDRHQVG